MKKKSNRIASELDISFIFCPYSGHPPPHRFDITLGAAYLAAFLQENGLKTAFYFGKYDNDPAFGQILDSIARNQPGAIGFTVYGSNLPETVALSRAIKGTFPQMPIIWGGPEIRFKPAAILEKYHQVVDVCIAGEAEKPLLRLLTSGTHCTDPGLAAIPGVYILNPDNGNVIGNPPGSTILEDCTDADKQRALDIYPSPYLAGVIPERYFEDKTVGSLFTSRGCPFKCAYCQFSALLDHRVYFHSIDRVISEIEWIQNTVLKFHPEKDEVLIMIYDEALTLSRKRIEALCHSLISKNYNPPVRLWIDTRADYIDEDLLKLLKKAGARQINFGLESAVPRVLKKIGKVPARRDRKEERGGAERRFLERVQKTVKWSKAQGLHTTVSMIVGLPTETLADARRTLDFVKNLDVDLYYHNFLNVLEGTSLAVEAKHLGYEWDQFPPGYMGKYGHRYTKAPIQSRSLMPLKNARIFQRDRNRFSVLCRGWRYISKCYPLSKNTINYNPFVFQIETLPSDPDAVVLAVSKYAGLSTTILCREDVQWPDETFSQLFSGLPVKNGRFYKLPGLRNSTNRVRGIEEADHSTPYYIPFKNLADFRIPDDGRRVFVTVGDDNDVEALFRWIRHYKNEKRVKLDFEQADSLNFDLFESCRWFRWSDTTCPAPWLTHMYCNTSLGLKPCRHFPEMSSANEEIPLKEFRCRTERYIRRKTEERGCLSCPVNEECPQCVAPFPLADSEYCDFQLNYLAG